MHIFKELERNKDLDFQVMRILSGIGTKRNIVYEQFRKKEEFIRRMQRMQTFKDNDQTLPDRVQSHPNRGKSRRRSLASVSSFSDSPRTEFKQNERALSRTENVTQLTSINLKAAGRDEVNLKMCRPHSLMQDTKFQESLDTGRVETINESQERYGNSHKVSFSEDKPQLFPSI